MRTFRMVFRTIHLIALGVLLAVWTVLSWLFGSWARGFLALCLLAAALYFFYWRPRAHPHPVRVATFNIRRFGVEPTDMKRLQELLAGVDADIIAVQEVQSPPHLADLAQRLSTSGRRFAYLLSACGGKSEMHVGFLYDSQRVRPVALRELPELVDQGGYAPSAGKAVRASLGGGRCSEGERPGLLAGFLGPDGKRVDFLTLHLASGAASERVALRREQWRRALTILRAAVHPVVLLGDTNSTGYLDNGGGERDFIDGSARRAGLEVATAKLACSEYFRSDGLSGVRLEPSLLDHVVTTPGLASGAKVHGFCAALSCQRYSSSTGHAPEDFERVSDHCPVSFDLR